MRLDKFEIWVHDYILKNENVRHFLYGAYQRLLYVVSEKVKCEGNVEVITPNDGYEYLFGYYDKCPWDSTGRYMLALRVKNATKEADSAEQAKVAPEKVKVLHNPIDKALIDEKLSGATNPYPDNGKKHFFIISR